MSDGKGTILHVDDDEANRYAVTRSLVKAGFVVTEATSGEDALRKVAKKPDLVILDVRLPDMDGFEVCRRIKSDPATAGIPVMHLSASFISGQDKAFGLDGGADGYLVRPVEPVELVATVNALLRAKRSEQKLRESEARFRLVVESIQDYAIFMTDLQGRITSWNLGAERILGYAEEEVIGRPTTMFFTPEDCDADVPAREMSIAKAEGRVTDLRWHQRKGGERFFVDGVLTAVTDDAGRLIGFTRLMRDVTEREQAAKVREGLLAENKRQALIFDTALSHITDFAYMLDRDGRFLYVNKPLLDLWGLKLEDAVGKNFFDLHYPEELAARLQRQVAQVIETKKGLSDETPYTSPTGALGYYEYIFSPVISVDGSVEVVAGSTRVITERKRGEEELRSQSERLRAALESEQAARLEAERAGRIKDEFLATLSHELRTPLNAILGWSQIINRPNAGPKDVRQGLEVIDRNARAQSQIIEDLLDMSSIISGKVRLDVHPVSVPAIVGTAVETSRPAAEAKGVQLRASIDPLDGLVVHGDANRLQQVMWNLLTNAVKFTPKGGRIDVSLGRTDAELEIAVIDSGEGIRPDFLPFVFDRFRQADASTTRRHGGLGLGLSIVKQLVELHGGTIRAASDGPGRGTAFTLTLPIANSPPSSEPDPDRPEPQVMAETRRPADACTSVEGLRVLVVDDEPDARVLLKRLLEDCKANVLITGSVDEAVGLVAGGACDVMVSDIGMPGEDGYALLRRVRSLGKDSGGAIPVIALTAYARAEDAEKAIAASFTLHICKPVEPAALIAAVAKAARSAPRA